MLTLVTAPLLLAYPDPTDPVDPSQRATVLARRRLTYTFVAISEAGFVATTAWQYLAGGSGMTDGALLTATALVAGFGLARSFVL